MPVPPDPPTDRAGSGLLLMALFGLWSGGLGIGFAVVLVVAAERLGPLQTVLYVVIAALMLLASARTLYELARRLRGG